MESEMKVVCWEPLVWNPAVQASHALPVRPCLPACWPGCRPQREEPVSAQGLVPLSALHSSCLFPPLPSSHDRSNLLRPPLLASLCITFSLGPFAIT